MYNYGIIKDIDVDLTMKDGSSGVANVNFGLINRANINVEHIITNNHYGGEITGVVGRNQLLEEHINKPNYGEIKNVDVNVTIDVYLTSEHANGKTGYRFAAVAYYNEAEKGNQDGDQVKISNVNAHIELDYHDSYAPRTIGAFVGYNRAGGYIVDSEVSGYIYGEALIGGFVYANEMGRLGISVIERVKSYVDMYANNNSVAGLAIVHQGNNTAPRRYSQIIDSYAYGIISGKAKLARIFLEGSSYGDGRVIDSEGFGELIYIND